MEVEIGEGQQLEEAAGLKTCRSFFISVSNGFIS